MNNTNNEDKEAKEFLEGAKTFYDDAKALYEKDVEDRKNDRA